MVNKELVETGLEIAGGLIDGAVGNGIETGVDGYKSYEDFKSGNDVMGVIDGGMPLINGLTSEQMLTQLKAFKSGAREGTIMPQLAKGYTDEQLEIIANQLGKK